MCSERYVSESLSRLERDGYIEISRRPGRRNNYTILTPELSSGHPRTERRAPPNSVQDTPELSSDKPVREPVIKPVSKPLATTTENFSPDERLKQQLAAIGLSYSKTDLIEYQIYLDAKIEKDHVINPRNSFLKWLKVRHVELENQKHRTETKQKKSNLYDLGDRELMKLCETHGIGTHGKTTKELVEKLRAVV